MVAKMEIAPDGRSIRCSGEWTLAGIEAVQPQIKQLAATELAVSHLQMSSIVQLDTTGAWVLYELIKSLSQSGKVPKLLGLDPGQQALYDLVTDDEHIIESRPMQKTPKHNVFYKLGKRFIEKWENCLNFIAFFGELVVVLLGQLRKPWKINWRAIYVAIEQTGVNALPIIALMSFLIGVVLAYQMGLQLEAYDANIYIVDLSGMAILREFGPLIAAIIAAGRTSTAFTSEIGSMKINEELDALRTMGISPVQRLVLPKLIGFVIALPLLTVWADVFGMLGSMVMSKNMLGVSFNDFIFRFHQVIGTKNYVVGLVKAPVFAFTIATVGCFQGFLVGNSADSVGKMTTRSAVQSLFLVMILDAIFSIVFSMGGI